MTTGKWAASDQQKQKKCTVNYGRLLEIMHIHGVLRCITVNVITVDHWQVHGLPVIHNKKDRKVLQYTIKSNFTGYTVDYSTLHVRAFTVLYGVTP